MYLSFGSKPALLREVMIARRNRKGGPTDVAAQSWIQDVLRTRDQRRALAIIVENGTEILRRLAPIADAMTAARLTDRDVADVLWLVCSASGMAGGHQTRGAEWA
jgi:hypothetical protein